MEYCIPRREERGEVKEAVHFGLFLSNFFKENLFNRVAGGL